MNITGLPLKITYRDAAMCPPCASNSNGFFSEREMSQFQKLLKPYIEAGILHDFGCFGSNHKALVAKTRGGGLAFFINKDSHQGHPHYGIGIPEACEYKSDIDLSKVRGILRTFLQTTFPQQIPAFSPV